MISWLHYWLAGLKRLFNRGFISCLCDLDGQIARIGHQHPAQSIPPDAQRCAPALPLSLHPLIPPGVSNEDRVGGWEKNQGSWGAGTPSVLGPPSGFGQSAYLHAEMLVACAHTPALKARHTTISV